MMPAEYVSLDLRSRHQFDLIANMKVEQRRRKLRNQVKAIDDAETI